MSDAVLTLNDGKRIPQLGFGVWRLSDEEAPAIVGAAFEAGYRSIDTAAMYGNEAGIGRAIAASGLKRDEIFVATKVWNDRHGFDETLRACDESLSRLGLDHVDLYLVHWPVPQRNAYVDTWRALMRLREDGRARSIGVCNFTVEHLTRVIDATGSTPSVNQVELHPRFQQTALRAFHAEAGIVTEAWAPLGRGGVLDDPAIRAIAGSTAAARPRSSCAGTCRTASWRSPNRRRRPASARTGRSGFCPRCRRSRPPRRPRRSGRADGARSGHVWRVTAA